VTATFAPVGAETVDEGTSPEVQLARLGRMGRFVARHHRWFAVAWLAVLLFGAYLGGVYKKSVSDNFRIPGTDSQAAYDLLSQRFTGQSGATATVVFAAPPGTKVTDPANAAAIDSTVTALAAVPGVASATNPLTSTPEVALAQFAAKLPPAESQAVLALGPDLPPFVAPDGSVAYLTLTFTDSIVDLLAQYPPSPDESAGDYANPWSQLDQVLTPARQAGLTAVVGGQVADTWNQPVSWWANHADEVGLGLGALLLLVAFGSLFGMAIPIATALFGAVTASGLVYLLASVVTVSSAAPPVTLMISLGVGLDYSLLIVTRYRQYLADGYEPADAVGLAMGSAEIGRASCRERV
jgi:RND superfamily putative drug exporter